MHGYHRSADDTHNTSTLNIYGTAMHRCAQIKEKNAMHTQVILNPSNTLLNSEYKRLRNELTSSLRNCELQYYSNKLELNKSDLKKIGMS